MTSKRIFGIDLGTTYSCVSYVDEFGKPVIVTNADSELTTPSVVFFESPDNIIVGKEAKNSSKVYPDRVATFIKREMGNNEYTYEVDGKHYKPEQVSSCILRKLVADAMQSVGEITDVVITCPAYFGISEREATKNAGMLAGLEVHHVLNEPTAAAIYYGVDKTKDGEVVLVYDLGGGTFDVTVIAIKEGNIQVVFTDGNHALGGKDWDDLIIGHLADEFMSQCPDAGDPRDDPQANQELSIIAEDAKKTLSSREKLKHNFAYNGGRAAIELTREKLEEITGSLLEQTIQITQRALAGSRERGYPRIDRVLLVGGSSKMPTVARRVKEAFGLEPQLFEPDLAVAKGAALMGMRILAGLAIKEVLAEQQGGKSEDVDLEKIDAKTLAAAAEKASEKMTGLRLPSKELAALATGKIGNVCSKSFGVVALNAEQKEYVAHLIHNNTAVPVEVTETFGTNKENQSNVLVQVMEQAGETESGSLDSNKMVGEGMITGLPPNLPKGSPLEVTFVLGTDGRLRVTAVEPRSGRSVNLEIEIQGAMSAAEVEEQRGMMLRSNVS